MYVLIYCTCTYMYCMSVFLCKILGLWEKACEEIENRESVLLRLEKFEETASRPNRFFKGYLFVLT